MKSDSELIRPWTPFQILISSIFIGPASGGAISGFNYVALGKPKSLLYRNLIIGVLLTVAEAVVAVVLVPREFMSIVIFSVNLV